MSYTVPHVHLIQASVDPDDQSDFRILVDHAFVGCLRVNQGLYDVDGVCFGPTLASMLPALPAGDWNSGHISRDSIDERPFFAKAEKRVFPGITSRWHELKIDYEELGMGEELRSNVYEATHPQFESEIIVKFARFE